MLDTGQPDSTALESGTTYYWRARANDGAFDGLWSGYLSFVTSASKPTAVELVAMTAGAERGVAVISWTVGSSDPPLSGFHIYRSLRQGGGFDRITTALLTGKDTFEYRDAGVMVNTVYYYLIEAVDALGESTQFGPVQLRVGAPNVFALHHNAPNPFNPTTTIRFDLPDPVKVTLIVYNILGQKVIRLINNRATEAGFHKILWHSRNEAGRATASGIYFYHIQAGDFVKTRKMLLLK
ncbi:MAG TPA: hypothetical protein DIT99_30355 [Candidatus Latescibacteria bacterium]|nr:hypothetical protein [Candidatus Latescibacterota bacterium]